MRAQAAPHAAPARQADRARTRSPSRLAPQGDLMSSPPLPRLCTQPAPRSAGRPTRIARCAALRPGRARARSRYGQRRRGAPACAAMAAMEPGARTGAAVAVTATATPAAAAAASRGAVRGRFAGRGLAAAAEETLSRLVPAPEGPSPLAPAARGAASVGAAVPWVPADGEGAPTPGSSTASRSEASAAGAAGGRRRRLRGAGVASERRGSSSSVFSITPCEGPASAPEPLSPKATAAFEAYRQYQRMLCR